MALRKGVYFKKFDKHLCGQFFKLLSQFCEIWFLRNSISDTYEDKYSWH